MKAEVFAQSLVNAMPQYNSDFPVVPDSPR